MRGISGLMLGSNDGADMVIAELKSIQDRAGYISDAELHDLSARLKIPVHELFGVASFYPHFRLKPPPRMTLHVCSDLACHMKGAQKILSRAEAQAAADPSVEVKRCSCLGQCDRAPALLVNDEPFADAGIEQILSMIPRAIGGEPVRYPKLNGLPGPFKTDPYKSESERYGVLKQLIASRDYEGVIKKLSDAGLRGMGGAGFATGKKWDAVAKSAAPEKYIICNADESEVGTFKDRELMLNLPWLLVEAMIIAGVTTGATRGFIYCRHEYHDQIHVLEEEIKHARSMNLIGQNLLGSGKAFELSVFVSPGGYVQGEETALMEAIEGKRGQPRNKLVDFGLNRAAPVFNGLWGKPTVINNVETLCYLPAILSHPAEWWKAQGANGFVGLKWIGVSGDVEKPGVFEVPMGTTYDDAINKYAGGVSNGRALKAFAPSGPSGGFLPASMLNLNMDFDAMANAGSMLGSGAIVAVAEGRCMVDLALNETRFFRNESCGKCVPCRLGTQKLADILYGITQATARQDDLETVERVAMTMYQTSICGLGQFAPYPIRSVLKYWRNEVEDHLKQKKCPAGVCSFGR